MISVHNVPYVLKCIRDIFKENPRMAQLVERRRQLLADKPRAEALGADGDEVIVLKKSCVVVFAGGCCI